MPSAITGNARLYERLSRAVASGILPHAFLLAGPSGVGKTAMLLSLAGEGLAGSGWNGAALDNPDLWVEDSPSDTIGIDRIRATGGGNDETLMAFLAKQAFAGGERFVVIARAERLSLEAANSLLKVVEEPPPGVHLMLATQAPEQLPSTLRSRVVQYHLQPVPEREVTEWLVAQGFPPEVSSRSAAQSLGRPGLALALARQPERAAAGERALTVIAEVAGHPGWEVLGVSSRLAREKDGLDQQVEVWVQLLRAALRASLGLPSTYMDPSMAALAGQLGQPGTTEDLRMALETAVGLAAALRAHANVRLAMDVALLELAGHLPLVSSS